MKKELIEDIIEWDVKNWSKSLKFWSENVDVKNHQKTCLELGGRRGGLSLWLAINGNNVICSDLESPEVHASKLHAKYSCSDKIEYCSIDATHIPYENKFDIVIFKSILGGISGNGKDELKQKTIDEIYKSLKPSGKLLFAENLESSVLHKTLRKKFISWGSRWNYLKFEEIDTLFNSFENTKYRTVGFFGAFGRTEKQRKLLSIIDNIMYPVIPKSKKYIVYGIAEKGTKPNNK
jgi:SAM-dependent methyltransferase